MTRYLRTSQLAEQLGLAPKTVQRLARAGELPHLRVGLRTLLFDPDEVTAALKARARGHSPEPVATK